MHKHISVNGAGRYFGRLLLCTRSVVSRFTTSSLDASGELRSLVVTHGLEIIYCFLMFNYSYYRKYFKSVNCFVHFSSVAVFHHDWFMVTVVVPKGIQTNNNRITGLRNQTKFDGPEMLWGQNRQLRSHDNLV